MVLQLLALVVASQFSVVSGTEYGVLLDRMETQGNRTAHGDPSKYPSQTSPGQTNTLNKWKTSQASGWTSGFFPGFLWQLYNITGKAEWATLALKWTEGLRAQQTNNRSHDIGFKVFNSFGQGLQLAAKEGSFAAKEVARLGYKEVVLTAANTLATRFSEVVGCTMSWNPHAGVCSKEPSYAATFPVIIDNMMNLEMLFWAAKNGGNTSLHRLAESHANKTAANHVRADGSTFHVVDYNPNTGAVSRRCTHQGLNDSSTWSRGQAWCVYGFTAAYRFTRQPLHLQTAQRCADYFLSKVEEQVKDSVALWDFDWGGSRGSDRRDVSASSVVASGLLELAGYAKDGGERYQAAAAQILKSLSVPATSEVGYLGDFDRTQGVLVHAMVENPEFSARGQDVSLVYSSYYALEALRRSERAPATVMV